MIADYSDLIAEVTESSEYTGLATRAALFTGLLETYLNKKLRIADMESEATLTTDASGEVSLPADFKSERYVLHNGISLPHRQALRVKSDNIYHNYTGYTVIGRKIVSSVTEGDIVVGYYQQIPSLSANSTNWLLTSNPEIYLQGLLWRVAIFKNDAESAGILKAYLDDLIDDIKYDDAVLRHAGSIVSIGGPTP